MNYPKIKLAQLVMTLLLAFVTQSAWATDNYTPTKMSTAPTEGPWKFDAVNNGYWGNGWNVWARSFNGMDHSAWDAHSDGSNITYQWQDGDGTGFSMHCKSIVTSQYGVFSTYTHSESVPAYTRKVLTWNYTLRGKSSYYPQNVTLYAHTDLATLKATAVDFTHDYSNHAGSTYHLAHLAQGGNSGTKETSTLTKTFEFDNRNGSSAQTKTWALLLTHVVNNTSSSTDDCHQWGSFKHYSSSWATYYYKYVTFNSNGGTGTMSQQTVVNSANLTANAFTREGYTFAGWATSVNGDVVYANGAEITATSNSKGPVTLYAQWTFQGSGTENDPYLIPSADVWNFLADKVNAGNAYSGKYFQLTADIGNAVNPLTRMLGIASNQLQETDKPFMGTFDGAGHTLYFNLTATDGNGTGPFLYIKEATIKNLHIDGIVSGEGTNYNRIGGLYGRSGGGATIDNCRISVNIKGGAWSVGGVGGESYTTIRNTVYDGKLECPKSGAGFIGWSSSTAILENCVFDPQEGSYITKKEDEGDRIMGPFYRYGNSDAILTNCYYLTSLGDAQGEQARTITAGTNVTINGLGASTGTYNVSGITAYTHGIKYNDVYYAGSGDVVSLSLGHTPHSGYDYVYSVNSGSLANPTTNSPTLTMPSANVTINVQYSATKHIEAYTSGADGWYLIASPMIEDVNPEDVSYMLSNNYDLFYFDQNREKEWVNYKESDGNYNPSFDLVSGKGYLYANSEDVDLTFIGTPYSSNGVVSLNYSEENSDPNMWGWNLIGNPFGTTATIDKPFYRMNEYHTEIIASDDYNIDPMEGVFVHRDNDGPKTATFTSGGSKGGERSLNNIVINLERSNGTVIDRAIVSFDEDRTLPKFQIGSNSTKLYIPKDGEEYAIAYSDQTGEMPLNFRAAENGEYTLSVTISDPVNIHLIDNLTGADIHLLSTPSYSFTAKTTDYVSRFRLIFSANENDGSTDSPQENEDFAFIGGDGQLIIHGSGTIQIIDLLGRVINTKSTEERIDTNGMTPGVYVLQLITGSAIKTQRIVVK